MEPRYSETEFICSGCGAKLIVKMEIHRRRRSAADYSFVCPKCGAIKLGLTDKVISVQVA